MTDTPALLQIDDLHVHYADGVDALRGVSLAVQPGRTRRADRPQRRGQDHADAGDHERRAIHAGGSSSTAIEVSKQTEQAARSRCGMIFQDAEDHLFMPTLLDDVAFGPLNQGCDAERSPAACRRGDRAGGADRPGTALGAPHVGRPEAGCGAGHRAVDAGQAAAAGRARRQPRRPLAPPADRDPRRPHRSHAAGDARPAA